jgi:hypothetical protein
MQAQASQVNNAHRSGRLRWLVVVLLVAVLTTSAGVAVWLMDAGATTTIAPTSWLDHGTRPHSAIAGGTASPISVAGHHIPRGCRHKFGC